MSGQHRVLEQADGFQSRSRPHAATLHTLDETLKSTDVIHFTHADMTAALALLVNIDVDDLERAMSFYGSTFGLSVGRRFGSSGVEMLGASSPLYLLVRAAGTRAAPATPGVRTYERHWTPVHLDFVVEEIEPVVERAVLAGAKVEVPIADHDWGRIAMLADPFGHGFCVIQFLGRGYDEITS